MYVTKGPLLFRGSEHLLMIFGGIFFHIANDAPTAFVPNYHGPNIDKDTKP
jgi:hypothetical protein